MGTFVVVMLEKRLGHFTHLLKRARLMDL